MKIHWSSIARLYEWSHRARFLPNISWLLVLPVSIWGIAALYLPLLGEPLSPARTWATTFLIIVLITMSLTGHVVGHTAAARLLNRAVPAKISVFLFGDAAQIWPSPFSTWKEWVVALAGPITNLVIAGLAYLVWNAQLNPYLNLSMPIVAIFNLWLAGINFAPVFPFDGGRLVNTLVFRFSDGDTTDFRMFVWLGFLAAIFELGWGLFLIAQNVRYSLETGAATIFLAVLAVWGLVTQPSVKQERPNIGQYTAGVQWMGAVFSGLVFLVLAAVASSLLLTNNGVEAPGVALSVEPMIEVSAQYRHPAAGTFLLTSVIQQSPIPAGVWVAGQFSPVLTILPPEKITPNQASPQENARQGFQMLDQSILTASVVGLQLAGFNASEVGKGAGVNSILPGSPAQGRLLPGDIITAVNGSVVHTANDLIDLVKTLDPLSTIHLTVLRDQQNQEISLPLMAPAKAGDPPRIGIMVQDAGFESELPIPVKIVPQKIVGGPSAGLMFTLTLYNMLTPDDLTGGRRIAGTGTINPDGSVGPIGGVQQKVAAAEAAGAEYFLSPMDNYADAASVATKIKVIKVATVEDAIAFLQSLPVY
jgi:PDZ domain-containing protein